jgi:S1-C subfamily serine protease
MTQPTDPGTTNSPYDYPTAPPQPIAYDESAYEAPPPAVTVRPLAPPARPPSGNGVGRGAIVVTAVLAAVLAAGGTFGLVEMTLPAAAPAATNAPAKLTSTSTTVPTSSGSANQPIVQIAASASPAVVTITASGSGGFGRNSGASIGSGMIVTSDGYILTNRHVIATGGTLTVQLSDGRQFEGTVVGTDPAHDVAVVKIAATGLPTVTLGNSDNLEIGQLAIAIGDPLGTFAGTVTTGIVSGTGREIDVQDEATGRPVHLTGLIQTDAAINEGNSGGPLLNAAGQVIGINTATDSSAEGIGFAVPINIASTLLTQAEAGQATTN